MAERAGLDADACFQAVAAGDAAGGVQGDGFGPGGGAGEAGFEAALLVQFGEHGGVAATSHFDPQFAQGALMFGPLMFSG